MEEYKKVTIDFYNNQIENYIQATQGLQDRDWVEKFTKKLEKQSKILDAGCGFGRETKTFIKKGFVCVGIDLSEKMIEEAKKRVPQAEFLVGDIEHLPFEHNSFEAIWCNATITHVRRKDLPKVFLQMSKVLQSSGLLYFNAKEGTNEGIIEDNRYGRARKFHSQVTFSEINQILANANFTVVDSKTTGSQNTYQDTKLIYVLAQKK